MVIQKAVLILCFPNIFDILQFLRNFILNESEMFYKMNRNKRCSSPDTSGNRCKKSSGEHDFCAHHYEKAKPLYAKYKKFENDNQ